MSKKSRNKKYRPRAVATNPLSDIFGGMSNAHAEHLQVLFVKNHAAVQAMTQGRGTREHWDLIVGALNIGNILCEQGIGNEFRAQMLAGRDVMCEVGKRAVKTGRFVFKGDELRTLNEAMDCHDAQLENVRAIDIDRATDEMVRRLRHGINTTSIQREIVKPSMAPNNSESFSQNVNVQVCRSVV